MWLRIFKKIGKKESFDRVLKQTRLLCKSKEKRLSVRDGKSKKSKAR